MKIAIVGSRNWNNNKFIEMIIKAYFKKDDIFVSGGARGVDRISEQIIDEWNKIGFYYSKTPDQTGKIIFKPDWDKYGKRAGFVRNKLIIDEADMVIAFWNGKSKGTKHSIDLAIKAGKLINIYVRPL